MSNYSLCFFLLILLVASATFAQGGDLLIQQYSKGPSLGQSYSKWSLYAGTEINRINTDLSTTSPTIALGALFHLEYRFSKSVGLVTGANFTPISYSYPISDSLGKDQLKYISFPLFLRVHPTEKVSLGFGALYNRFQEGLKTVSLNDTSNSHAYPKGVFANSYGFVVQGGYHFWKRFYAYFNYRWAKKTSPLTQIETNNTKGIQLGVTYAFWESFKRQ